MTFLPVIGIGIFSLVLIKATDVLVKHLKVLAHKTELGGFFLSTLIVGLATSLPEISVGVTAALNGVPNIAMGNSIGSNIANLSIIAGGAALVGGRLRIENHSYGRDLIHAFLAGAAPLFLLMDNALSRVDALILIALYGFYNYLILKKRTTEIVEHAQHGVLHVVFSKIRHEKTGKHFALVFLSIAIVLFSADMIVRFGTSIAEGLDISVLLVGIVFVAIGTSLPEFVVELKAIREGSTSLYLGNLLGSVVANGTLVVGITALISPITIRAFTDYLLATVFFLSIFTFFYFFVQTHQRLARWEGALLVMVYVLFVLLEFM